MTTQLIVVSRYQNSPHFNIEGRGYHTRTQAREMIDCFKERRKALNEINKRYGFDEIGVDLKYTIAEINVPDDFFKN